MRQGQDCESIATSAYIRPEGRLTWFEDFRSNNWGEPDLKPSSKVLSQLPLNVRIEIFETHKIAFWQIIAVSLKNQPNMLHNSDQYIYLNTYNVW